MENPGSNENKNSSNLNIQGGTILTDTLLQIFKYNRLNKAFSEAHDKDPIVLISALLEQLDIKIDINGFDGTRGEEAEDGRTIDEGYRSDKGY